MATATPSGVSLSQALRDQPPRERFVREPERIRLTGLSRSAWYKLEKEGKVPRRLRLNPRTVAWRLTELEDWMACVAAGEKWSERRNRRS